MIYYSDIRLDAILIGCDFPIEQIMILADKYILSFSFWPLVTKVLIKLKPILFVEEC